MSERMLAANNTTHSMTGNRSQPQSQNIGDNTTSANDNRQFISNGVKGDPSITDNNQGDVGSNAQRTSSSTGRRDKVSFSDPVANGKTTKSAQANKREGDNSDNVQQQGSENQQHKVEDQPEQGVGGLTGNQHYGKIDLKNI